MSLVIGTTTTSTAQQQQGMVEAIGREVNVKSQSWSDLRHLAKVVEKPSVLQHDQVATTVSLVISTTATATTAAASIPRAGGVALPCPVSSGAFPAPAGGRHLDFSQRWAGNVFLPARKGKGFLSLAEHFSGATGKRLGG